MYLAKSVGYCFKFRIGSYIHICGCYGILTMEPYIPDVATYPLGAKIRVIVPESQPWYWTITTVQAPIVSMKSRPCGAMCMHEGVTFIPVLLSKQHRASGCLAPWSPTLAKSRWRLALSMVFHKAPSVTNWLLLWLDACDPDSAGGIRLLRCPCSRLWTRTPIV